VAFQAQRVGLANPQQVLVIVAVRIMADGASLLEGRLMRM